MRRTPSTCRCRGCVRPSAAIASPRTAAATRCASRTAQLHLRRFEELRARAAGAGAEAAAALLREALALWRGAPLADLADDGIPHAELAHLEEARLVALDERIDADLELGRHRALVPELDALVALHPYREHYREAQMLALYRSGRQADALAAYEAARRTLRDDLGLEPGDALRRLHGAILRQDPALVARSATGSLAEAAAARPRPGRRTCAVASRSQARPSPFWPLPEGARSTARARRRTSRRSGRDGAGGPDRVHRVAHR